MNSFGSSIRRTISPHEYFVAYGKVIGEMTLCDYFCRCKEGRCWFIAQGVRMLRLFGASHTCSNTCTSQVCTHPSMHISQEKFEVIISEWSFKQVASAYYTMCFPQFNCRKSFPSYLQEGMLEAISIQALAQVSSPVLLIYLFLLYYGTQSIISFYCPNCTKQCVEIQLGLASECEKATLSVKRRLACEQVSYFSQVSIA